MLHKQFNEVFVSDKISIVTDAHLYKGRAVFSFT